MIQLEYLGSNVVAIDQSSIDLLSKGFFGTKKGKEIKLSSEEALYLMDVRNAECKYDGENLSANDFASKFWKSKKFCTRYFTYKDWRDRGLIIKPIFKANSNSTPTYKSYPKTTTTTPDYKVKGTFFTSNLMTIVQDQEKGKDLYENFWFGQYGSYKAPERGKLNKLDIYETLYLIDNGVLSPSNISKKEILRIAKSRRHDFESLYGVYKDWRNSGYVIKTGFKFGTHFRLYFPGARPLREGDDNESRAHSKHVIHVFPKASKLLISEWARAIRVAHSVRKTFILAVPGNLKPEKTEPDFMLYHRKGSDAENPDNSQPRFAMLSLSEEEKMGGNEFASAISTAKEMKLEPAIAIVDRETSVTYYRVRQIKLQGSNNEYYEIEWMQP